MTKLLESIQNVIHEVYIRYEIEKPFLNLIAVEQFFGSEEQVYEKAREVRRKYPDCTIRTFYYRFKGEVVLQPE